MILGDPYNFQQEILWFVSSPVRPQKGETQIDNVLATASLLTILENVGLCVTAPYIGSILADKSNARTDEQVFRAMEIDRQVLSRCDGIILLGDRISEGMHNEMVLAMGMKKPVWYMVNMSIEEMEDSARELKELQFDLVDGACDLDGGW